MRLQVMARPHLRPSPSERAPTHRVRPLLRPRTRVLRSVEVWLKLVDQDMHQTINCTYVRSIQRSASCSRLKIFGSWTVAMVLLLRGACHPRSLLCTFYVCNPATKKRAALPGRFGRLVLAFDPRHSPHTTMSFTSTKAMD